MVIDDTPDLSAWARFGNPYTGGPGMLGEEWRYTIGAGASIILSAAGGELENQGVDAGARHEP